MQVTMKAQIIGATFNKGKFEDTEYDYTRVNILQEIDSSAGTAVGLTTGTLNFGTSENKAKLEKLTFPFMAELLVDIVTNGKTQKMNLIDFKAIK